MRSLALPGAAAPREAAPPALTSSRETPGGTLPARAAGIVGRSEELAQLQAGYAQVLRGQRQVMFVTGEAGIGKSTVVAAFVRALTAKHPPCVGYGQCVEQYGAGEGYLPVLGALSQIGQGPHGARLTQALLTYASRWLGLVPGLAAPGEQATAQTPGGSQDRQLRELAE